MIMSLTLILQIKKNKMKIAKIPLQAFSRFHFGNFNTDNDVALNSTSVFAHSDTLFSALVNSYSDKFEGAEDFIDCFKSNQLQISSQFYYIEKGNTPETIYLLPKPVFLDVFTKRDGNHKNRNRIQFVSLEVWQEGFNTSEWFIKDNKNTTVLNKDKYALVQDGEILLTKKEFNKFTFSEESTIFKTADSPKGPIRAHDKDSIFYQADVEIAKIKDITIGMYFLYNTAEPEAEKKLQIATNILSQTGIGGEKSNMGRTMKLPVFKDFDSFKTSNEGFENGLVNLSLLNPKDKNELQVITYSKTTLRGGTSYTGAKNTYKVIRMIQEGALINSNIEGRLVNIGNDYLEREVWRNGKAFLIPIMYKNEAE